MCKELRCPGGSLLPPGFGFEIGSGPRSVISINGTECLTLLISYARTFRDELVRRPRASDGGLQAATSRTGMLKHRNVKTLGAVGRSSSAKGSVEAIRACDRCRIERGEHRSAPPSGKRARRWNSRPRGGDMGARGGVKAGPLRSCPFRSPKGMAGGVSSGGLCGGSPVCASSGAQPAGSSARVRAEPGYDRRDVPIFGSIGLSAKQIVGEAEAGTADADDR
jgi:hypothetical protein